MSDPILDLASKLGVKLLENEPLNRHTSMRVGGPARYLALADAPGLAQLAGLADEIGMAWAVMGNGSNLLARDAGYDGLVLKLSPRQPLVDGCTITASSGTLLSTLAVTAQKHGLAGLAFAHGIPGSVGGAVYMNAGAYGGQIADVLLGSRYIDLADRGADERWLEAREHLFDYRYSLYMEHRRWMISEAVFGLTPGDPQAIAQEMSALARQRREKQPLEYPSGGSAFKRPPGHFAGQLIEQAGLKGFRVGDAQVSEKHAGFIVNRGGATCADVLAVLEHVERTVARQFGVQLERELRLL